MENKILIIDDEEVVLDSCTQILKGGDYQIATTKTGMFGLQLVEVFQPDLVFVDLKMPGMSGFEVLEKIRAIDSTVVAIVITGYGTIDSAVEAMKQGAYDFLPKPFTPDEFRLITRRGLEKRKLTLETMALRREKEMLRENYAAIVSHELKAPLSAVQQILFLLIEELSGQLTESQKNRFERLKSRINDMINMIHTWLRVLSVDIGKIKENFKPVSVPVVIAKAVESIQPHATRKNVEISSSVETVSGMVHGDEITLTEAVVNISNNAIKYSYPGSKVSIRTEEKDHHIIISISDTGVGIAKEDLPYIFEDFYRGKPSPTDSGGCGLGLAITRRLVQAHDGSLSVESEPGEGTTFVIKLPVMEEGKDRL